MQKNYDNHSQLLQVMEDLTCDTLRVLSITCPAEDRRLSWPEHTIG